MSLPWAVTAWLFTHRSENTRAAYEADLAHFAAWCANGGCVPMRVEDRDVARYRDDSVAAGASPATVSRRMSALASFYRHAEDAEAVDANPTDDVARPDTSDDSSTDELDEEEGSPAPEFADNAWVPRWARRTSRCPASSLRGMAVLVNRVRRGSDRNRGGRGEEPGTQLPFARW